MKRFHSLVKFSCCKYRHKYYLSQGIQIQQNSAKVCAKVCVKKKMFRNILFGVKLMKSYNDPESGREFLFVHFIDSLHQLPLFVGSCFG
jgi:hypothetical protein